MKLKNGFLNCKTGSEDYLMIDSSDSHQFHGVVRNNETASFIISCLKEDTTEAEIIRKMTERYDADEVAIESGVHLVLDGLRSIDALEE